MEQKLKNGFKYLAQKHSTIIFCFGCGKSLSKEDNWQEPQEDTTTMDNLVLCHKDCEEKAREIFYKDK